MPGLDPPPLTEEQLSGFVEQLYNWAIRDPHPDQPRMGFLGGELLTPLELYEAVVERTLDGLQLLEMVRYGLDAMSFDRLIEMMAAAPLDA